MTVIGVLALGVVVGFLPVYLLEDSHRPGIVYLCATLGVVFGGIFLVLLDGPDHSYWYLDGLGIGFLLYCIAMPGRRRKIGRLLRKSGLL
jgi:hypothetical protein